MAKLTPRGRHFGSKLKPPSQSSWYRSLHTVHFSSPIKHRSSIHRLTIRIPPDLSGNRSEKFHKGWPEAPAPLVPGVTTDIQSPYGAGSFEASQDMELPLRGPGILVRQDISSDKVSRAVGHELTNLNKSFRPISSRTGSPPRNHSYEERFEKTDNVLSIEIPRGHKARR